MPQALLDYLAPKKILLLGFGREGRSTYQYIRRHFPEKMSFLLQIKTR